MDEQQALLAIQSTLDLARQFYETMLGDKMMCSSSYPDKVGYGDLLKARGKVSMRIQEIEDEENEEEE